MHSYVVVTWLGSASEAAVAVINHVTLWSGCQCGRETGKFWVFRLLSARVGSALLSALGNRFGTRKSSCFVSAWLGGRYWSLLRSALSSHFWRPAWSLVSTSPVNFFFLSFGACRPRWSLGVECTCELTRVRLTPGGVCLPVKTNAYY